MRHVDALRRFPIIQSLKDNLIERLKQCQINDEKCSVIIELLKCGQKYKDYEVIFDLLYRFVNGAYLLVVSHMLQAQVIRCIHEKGHVSANKP